MRKLLFYCFPFYPMFPYLSHSILCFPIYSSPFNYIQKTVVMRVCSSSDEEEDKNNIELASPGSYMSPTPGAVVLSPREARSAKRREMKRQAEAARKRIRALREEDAVEKKKKAEQAADPDYKEKEGKEGGRKGAGAGKPAGGKR